MAGPKDKEKEDYDDEGIADVPAEKEEKDYGKKVKKVDADDDDAGKYVDDDKDSGIGKGSWK